MILPSYMRAGFAILLTAASASVVALHLNTNTVSWYNGLVKPALFSPTLQMIALAAVVTYILMGIASSLVWMHDNRPHDFRGWVPLFFTHLLVNTAWMVLFFGFNIVFLSLIVAFFLMVFALLLVCGAWETHRLSAYLLMPYLAWTVYILGMNIAIWFVN